MAQAPDLSADRMVRVWCKRKASRSPHPPC